MADEYVCKILKLMDSKHGWRIVEVRGGDFTLVAVQVKVK